MKHLFFAAFIILLASCKKDKAPAESAPAFNKNLISVTAPGQTDWTMFYANGHKLLSFKDNNMSVSYKPGVPFSAKKTMSGNVHEYKNAVQDAQGRIVKLERFVSGLLTSKQEFTYNADGYLSSHTVTSANYSAKFVYEYQSGNLSVATAHEGGQKTGTLEFDYYTNLYNPLHIDLFDFRSVGFVTDGQFGRQSKNLVKSVKMKTSAGQVFIAIDLSYTTDVDGYIKTITLSSTGQPVTTYTCTFQ